jgi:YVTN family beta-propeller protein
VNGGGSKILGLARGGLAVAALVATGCGSGSGARCAAGTMKEGDACAPVRIDGGPSDALGRDSVPQVTPTDASSDAGFTGWGPPACAGTKSVAVPAGGTLIASSADLREVVIDPCGEHAYVSNYSGNRIEDYAAAAGTLNTPLVAGAGPIGLDVTPDNRQLYVANYGETYVSIIDLATRKETIRANFYPSTTFHDAPWSIAIASNGNALFSTNFSGSGFGARMMSIDPVFHAVTNRRDYFIAGTAGTTTDLTYLKASGDRTAIGIVGGNDSGGPLIIYQAATDTFTPAYSVNNFIERVALNAHGTTLAVDSRYLFDATPSPLGTIADTTGGPFGAYGPSGAVLYRSASGAVQIVDTTTFQVAGSIAVTADTMTSFSTSTGSGSYVGNLAVSPDGTWLAMLTDHGITILAIP